MSFLDKFRPGVDPMEPASPPPFAVDDRVVVRDDADDPFLAGLHGKVIDIHFTTDPEDVFSPWVTRVHIDGMREPLKFEARELARETGPADPPAPLTAFVKQPEDTEPPAPHDDDYEPYTGGEVPSDSIGPWLQRAKELRHETVFTDTPVFDQVTAEALSADGLAAEVEAFLAEVAGGAA